MMYSQILQRKLIKRMLLRLKMTTDGLYNPADFEYKATEASQKSVQSQSIYSISSKFTTGSCSDPIEICSPGPSQWSDDDDDSFGLPPPGMVKKSKTVRPAPKWKKQYNNYDDESSFGQDDSDIHQLSSAPKAQINHAVKPPDANLKWGWTLEIIVDNGETQRPTTGKGKLQKHKIFNTLKDELHVPCRKDGLGVADYWFVAKNKGQSLVLPILIERKSANDLSASLKDGRFADQKYRMKRARQDRLEQSGQPTFLIYLVEGNLNYEGIGVAPGVTTGAMNYSLFICETDGLRIMETKDIRDTCRQLRELFKAIVDHVRDFGNEIELLSFCNYNNFQNYKKKYDKDSVTNPHIASELFATMLMSQNGISHVKAEKIVKYFPTLPQLMEKYESLDAESGKKLLQKCGLGPKRSEKLYNLFRIRF